MSLRPRSRVALALLAALVVPIGCSGDDQVERGGGPASTVSTVSSAAGEAPGSARASTSVVDQPGVERLTLAVISRVPHDTEAFTEGFTFSEDGRLFESLGLDGRSSVREIDPATGAVVRESALPSDQFGEGLAIANDELTQLTWKSGVVHRWSLDDLESIGQTSFTGEGWGLTYDGRRFVQSDGSGTLSLRDPSTFDPPSSTLHVTLGGRAVDELNELEYVDGVIWANVWHSDEILRIDPTTGKVTGVLDASSLWTPPERTSEMTLNGIAHRPGDPPDRLWLTGKNWPEMFEVTVR